MSPEEINNDFGVSPCSEQATQFLFRLDEGRKTKGKYTSQPNKSSSNTVIGKSKKLLRKKERKLKKRDDKTPGQQEEPSPYDFIESFCKKENVELPMGQPQSGFVLSLDSSSDDESGNGSNNNNGGNEEEDEDLGSSCGYNKKLERVDTDWKSVTYTDELRAKAKGVISAVDRMKKLLPQMSKEVADMFAEVAKACTTLNECVDNDEASFGYQRNWSGEVQNRENFDDLVEDFQHSAELYGKIIISEKQLQPRYKTIKTATAKLGGLYGGEKYLHHGLLFKFSDDKEARKAPSHELKALRKVGDLSKKKAGLYTPLFAVIHYKGFTISAQTVVPINQKTLVYGSDDGGENVVRDPVVHNMVNDIFGSIGLANHLSGLSNRQSICGPADMEIHRGSDNRLWVIDLHRLSPPTSSRNFLQELFRFEFLETYYQQTGKKLSSDAFSIFGGDENDFSAVQQNSVVKEAVTYLKNVHIREFVKHYKDTSVGGKEVTKRMQEAGINVRFTGLVWVIGSVRLRKILEVEMAARCIKKIIIQSHSKIATPLTSLSRHVQICVDILNKITQRGNFEFFILVCRKIRKTFDGVSKLDPRTFQHSILEFKPLEFGLIPRLCELCGIELTSEKRVQVLKESPFDISFHSRDIVHLKALIKVSWHN